MSTTSSPHALRLLRPVAAAALLVLAGAAQAGQVQLTITVESLVDPTSVVFSPGTTCPAAVSPAASSRAQPC